MCGIAGFFNYSNSTSQTNKDTVRQMTESLVHRGPDERGFAHGANWGVGHQRLKVIDLDGGGQPMRSEDGKATLVYNGEVYNFQEIRSELEARGRKFNSHSDTESVLQAFEVLGIDFLNRIQGMFALGLVDQREKKLFLAVDPFGKKPLYYADRGGQIIFASEIKALLKHPDISKEVDPVSLSQYLAFEYVPAPRSILKGVQKLEAGTCLEASESGVKVIRYTKPQDQRLGPRSDEEWSEVFLEGFRASVEKRLVSDVPLGVFLSGGLDSSAVLAMMRELNPSQTIKTFNIGFDEASFDESGYARQVSQYFDTEHIEEKCTLKDMVNEHRNILSHLDEPMADASFIPTFILCRLVRRYVTVALAGDGGDELFGGYPTFVADKWSHRMNGFPSVFIRAMEKMAQALPVSMDNISFDFKVKQFLKGMNYKGNVRNQVWLGAISDREQTNLLAPPMKSFAGEAYRPIGSNGHSYQDGFSKLQDFYFKYYLQGDILVKVDRASMANSLEVRAPLLDDAFVRVWRSNASNLKVRGNTTKYIFKKAMKGRLPDNIIHRSKKGFGIPIAHWIRSELKGQFEEALAPARIKKEGFFDPNQIQQLLQEHLLGKKDNRKQLWTLYVFQNWLNQEI